MKKLCLALLFCGFAATVSVENARAEEPGWSCVVIATGEYREQIKATPIEMRPYRPFHFYGNTVRRKYHRGTALPVPRSLANHIGKRHGR